MEIKDEWYDYSKAQPDWIGYERILVEAWVGNPGIREQFHGILSKEIVESKIAKELYIFLWKPVFIHP